MLNQMQCGACPRLTDGLYIDKEENRLAVRSFLKFAGFGGKSLGEIFAKPKQLERKLSSRPRWIRAADAAIPNSSHVE